MKVALCYSGLFKSWNHLHTQFEGIRNLLAPATNEIDFDVYIHSWDYKTNLQKVNKFKNTFKRDPTSPPTTAPTLGNHADKS